MTKYKYGGYSVNKHYNMLRTYNILESDTNDLGSTIHFDKRNLDTFGIRVYNLFFMSCNLFELVAKEIAGDSESDMGTWKKKTLICQYSKVELTFLPMGYKFKPLEALGEVDVNKRNLTWWQDYNSVKHNLTLIQKATLQNLIYALGSAGLLVSDISRPPIGVIYSSRRSVLFEGLHFPSL
jgi:hypothetical protein